MDSGALAVLVVELFAAIKILGGYPPPALPPEIHRVAQGYIEEEFCRRPCKIRAVYDPTQGVFIDATLDIENDVFARSILLHELVHHVQAVSGRFDMASIDCARQNRAEAEAYYLQNRYLMSLHHPSRVAMTGWAVRCADSEVPTPGQ
jgi:hypothetical protein